MSSLKYLVSIAAFTLIAIVPAQAQQPDQPARESAEGSRTIPPAGMQVLMKKREEIQQLNQQLVQIQRDTMADNPDLEEKRAAFVAMVETRIADDGIDPESARKNIETLKGELESGELSDGETRTKQQQLQKEVSELQQAQQSVLQEPDIQQERQTLNRELLEAMESRNPETRTLMTDLQKARKEYQQIVQSVMQPQSRGDSPSPKPAS